MTRRPTPDEIRENDLVHFIVNVRKLAAATTDPARNLKLIFNLANTVFRHYIGYAGGGAYRLKLRGEACVAEGAEAAAIREELRRLRKADLEEGAAPPSESARRPPRPRPLVEDASEDDLEFLTSGGLPPEGEPEGAPDGGPEDDDA